MNQKFTTFCDAIALAELLSQLQEQISPKLSMQLDHQSYPHLLSSKLNNQKEKDATAPKIKNVELNLSKTAGSTIEATETSPKSADISESFSSCLSFN